MWPPSDEPRPNGCERWGVNRAAPLTPTGTYPIVVGVVMLLLDFGRADLRLLHADNPTTAAPMYQCPWA
jgi:hypothetical protein